MKLLNTFVSLAITAAMATAVLGFGFKRASDAIINDASFSNGIYVNDIDVSGLSLDKASRALEDAESKRLDGCAMSILCEDIRRDFTARELGAVTNLKSVIDTAYGVGRNGTDMERLDIALAMRAGETERFYSVLSFGRAGVSSSAAAFAEAFYMEPANATATFDVTTRTFSYTREQDGRYIDEGALRDMLWQRVQAGDGGSVTAVAIPVKAECTEDMLRKATSLLGGARTKMPADADKRGNIALAAAALNGYVVMPGGAFSLNAITGERTEEKGYVRVQVLNSGDEGGGVSQLAGTLYRAALLADMEVVERWRPAAPAPYLPIGFDAALEWGDKDLKCGNKGVWPLYVAAYVENGELAVEIYGAPRADHLAVKLVNEVLETIKPPLRQTIIDSSLAEGQTVVEIQERNGYRVNTYRQYVLEEDVVDSVPLTSDNYPAVRGRVREGERVSSE